MSKICNSNYTESDKINLIMKIKGYLEKNIHLSTNTKLQCYNRITELKKKLNRNEIEILTNNIIQQKKIKLLEQKKINELIVLEKQQIIKKQQIKEHCKIKEEESRIKAEEEKSRIKAEEKESRIKAEERQIINELLKIVAYMKNNIYTNNHNCIILSKSILIANLLKMFISNSEYEIEKPKYLNTVLQTFSQINNNSNINIFNHIKNKIWNKNFDARNYVPPIQHEIIPSIQIYLINESKNACLLVKSYDANIDVIKGELIKEEILNLNYKKAAIREFNEESGLILEFNTELNFLIKNPINNSVICDGIYYEYNNKKCKLFNLILKDIAYNNLKEIIKSTDYKDYINKIGLREINGIFMQKYIKYKTKYNNLITTNK